MINFVMKFLYFCGFLFFGFITLNGFFLEMYKKHNYELGNWGCLFFFGGITLLFFWRFVSKEEPKEEPEEEPEEETKTETNIDNPENDEIISVTEIKGTRKIIKNGKVIFSEELKADELKYFEKFKE